MTRDADGKWGRRLYTSFMCLSLWIYVCIRLYSRHRIKMCMCFMAAGLCTWHARIKCAWESVAQAQVSLMGMTLPSAVQPCCVGKLCIFITMSHVTVNILSSVSIFFLLLHYFGQLPPFLSLFSLHHYLHLLLTIPAPFRLGLHPINAIQCDSDTGGVTAEGL